MPGISNGTNSRPLNDTIAETGPGIPDDAVADGELGPGDVNPAEAERQAQALRERGWTGSGDNAAEPEAHPS
jgi:hypothetical protein